MHARWPGLALAPASVRRFASASLRCQRPRSWNKLHANIEEEWWGLEFVLPLRIGSL